MPPSPEEQDIVIIGAGPAGLSLAAALAPSGLAITVVERQSDAVLASPPFDGREIALTNRSVAELRAVGAWHRIPQAEISPMREARVVNGASPHAISLRPRTELLGHFAPNYLIRRALYETVREAANVRLLTDTTATAIATSAAGASLTLGDGSTLSARLIVAADTRFSEMRRRMGIPARMRDFGRTMMVCRMAHDLPHDGVALEWFGTGQTFANLPLNGEADAPNISSMVITMPAREIDRLLALPEAEFNDEITSRTESRFGEARLRGTRHAYPLVAVYADRFVAPRFALVGDAAVGMHPVTAHGFNFGLVGAHLLAGHITRAARAGRDIASPGVLARYQGELRRATRPLFLATNATALLYTDDRLPARALRNTAIRVGERLGPLRRAITARLIKAA